MSGTESKEKKDTGLRPPRKTLQDAMAEVANADPDGVDEDFIGLAFRAKMRNTETAAAAGAYGVINRNSVALNSDTLGTIMSLADFSANENEGLNDLDLPSRLARVKVTKDATKINRWSVTGEGGDETSGRRGEGLSQAVSYTHLRAHETLR